MVFYICGAHGRVWKRGEFVVEGKYLKLLRVNKGNK